MVKQANSNVVSIVLWTSEPDPIQPMEDVPPLFNGLPKYSFGVPRPEPVGKHLIKSLFTSGLEVKGAFDIKEVKAFLENHRFAEEKLGEDQKADPANAMTDANIQILLDDLKEKFPQLGVVNISSFLGYLRDAGVTMEESLDELNRGVALEKIGLDLRAVAEASSKLPPSVFRNLVHDASEEGSKPKKASYGVNPPRELISLASQIFLATITMDYLTRFDERVDLAKKLSERQDLCEELTSGFVVALSEGEDITDCLFEFVLKNKEALGLPNLEKSHQKTTLTLFERIAETIGMGVKSVEGDYSESILPHFDNFIVILEQKMGVFYTSGRKITLPVSEYLKEVNRVAYEKAFEGLDAPLSPAIARTALTPVFAAAVLDDVEEKELEEKEQPVAAPSPQKLGASHIDSSFSFEITDEKLTELSYKVFLSGLEPWVLARMLYQGNQYLKLTPTIKDFIKNLPSFQSICNEVAHLYGNKTHWADFQGAEKGFDIKDCYLISDKMAGLLYIEAFKIHGEHCLWGFQGQEKTLEALRILRIETVRLERVASGTASILHFDESLNAQEIEAIKNKLGGFERSLGKSIYLTRSMLRALRVEERRLKAEAVAEAKEVDSPLAASAEQPKAFAARGSAVSFDREKATLKTLNIDDNGMTFQNVGYSGILLTAKTQGQANYAFSRIHDICRIHEQNKIKTVFLTKKQVQELLKKDSIQDFRSDAVKLARIFSAGSGINIIISGLKMSPGGGVELRLEDDSADELIFQRGYVRLARVLEISPENLLAQTESVPVVVGEKEQESEEKDEEHKEETSSELTLDLDQATQERLFEMAIVTSRDESCLLGYSPKEKLREALSILGLDHGLNDKITSDSKVKKCLTYQTIEAKKAAGEKIKEYKNNNELWLTRSMVAGFYAAALYIPPVLLEEGQEAGEVDTRDTEGKIIYPIKKPSGTSNLQEALRRLGAPNTTIAQGDRGYSAGFASLEMLEAIRQQHKKHIENNTVEVCLSPVDCDGLISAFSKRKDYDATQSRSLTVALVNAFGLKLIISSAEPMPDGGLKIRVEDDRKAKKFFNGIRVLVAALGKKSLTFNSPASAEEISEIAVFIEAHKPAPVVVEDAVEAESDPSLGASPFPDEDDEKEEEEPALPYKIIIHPDVLERIKAYKAALANGTADAGFRLKVILNGKTLSSVPSGNKFLYENPLSVEKRVALANMSLEEFIEQLLATKDYVKFAERDVKGAGIDWNSTEISLLSNINTSIPVLAFDDGTWGGADPIVHAEPSPSCSILMRKLG